MYTFWILSAFIAGVAVLLRTWLEDHPGFAAVLKSRLPFFSKVLQCGVCFVNWLSLFAVLVFSPFQDLMLPWRFSVPATLDKAILLLISWQALALVTIFIRYFVLATIELLKYFIGTLNKKSN